MTDWNETQRIWGVAIGQLTRFYTAGFEKMRIPLLFQVFAIKQGCRNFRRLTPLIATAHFYVKQSKTYTRSRISASAERTRDASSWAEMT